MKHTYLRNRIGLAALGVGAIMLSACATQTPPIEEKESQYSLAEQQAAQQQALAAHMQHKLSLKRKIALGRISNETLQGKSLLRDENLDVLGKQVTDLFSKALVESGNYIVLERPDIQRLKDEAELTGKELNLVDADLLVIGSLTEFGRSTTGESGFFSSSKKQTAFAKVDLRLVDTTTGQAITGFSGAGQADNETVNVFGFGSEAGYDGTINDKAIAVAVSNAVDSLTKIMEDRPWQTDILEIAEGGVFISGGQSQGIKIGMDFDVLVRGKKVKSKQSGFMIELPGEKIASIKVASLFGNSEADEGAFATITTGSIDGVATDKLVVQEVQ